MKKIAFLVIATSVLICISACGKPDYSSKVESHEDFTTGTTEASTNENAQYNINYDGARYISGSISDGDFNVKLQIELPYDDEPKTVNTYSYLGFDNRFFPSYPEREEIIIDVNYFWGATSEKANKTIGFTDEDVNHMIDTFEWIPVEEIPDNEISKIANNGYCNYVAHYNIPSSEACIVDGDLYIVRASIDGYPCSDSQLLSLTDYGHMLPNKEWVGVMPYLDQHQFYNGENTVEICCFDPSRITLKSANQSTLRLNDVLKSIYPRLKENCDHYFENNVRIYAAEIVYLPFGNLEPEKNSDGTLKDVSFEPFWAIYYQTGIGLAGSFNRETILVNAITGEVL